MARATPELRRRPPSSLNRNGLPARALVARAGCARAAARPGRSRRGRAAAASRRGGSGSLSRRRACMDDGVPAEGQTLRQFRHTNRRCGHPYRSGATAPVAAAHVREKLNGKWRRACGCGGTPRHRWISHFSGSRPGVRVANEARPGRSRFASALASFLVRGGERGAPAPAVAWLDPRTHRAVRVAELVGRDQPDRQLLLSSDCRARRSPYSSGTGPVAARCRQQRNRRFAAAALKGHRRRSSIRRRKTCRSTDVEAFRRCRGARPSRDQPTRVSVTLTPIVPASSRGR